MKKMLEVLQSDDDYPYIDDAAKQRLQESRENARTAGMTSIFSEKTGGYRIYPWLGTIQFDTLRRILQKVIGSDKVRSYQPYYIDVRTKLSEDQIVDRVYDYIHEHDIMTVAFDEDLLRYGKYDRFIPESLLLKEFVSSRLDTGFEL